jgi:DNA-binding CsgD family transcriptional regulator
LQKRIVRRWPLVGRNEELAFCAAFLSEDDVPGVVIAGAAGVGKTRLASEVLDTARRADYEVARATASDVARTIPLGAVSHLLPDGGFRDAAPFELLRAARASIVNRGLGRGLVVGVDDAHLLDAASATLVHQLAVSRDAFLVVTVRSGEPCPDSIVALWKDEACEYVALQPLAYAELADLLELVIGPMDGPSLHVLWEATLGTPLLVRELVLDGLERELLVERGGIWHWHGSPSPGRRLLELVEARLGVLEQVERTVVEAIALAGQIGRSFFAGDAAAAADALIGRGVVEDSRDGRRINLRMAHPLYAETVRASMSPARALCVQQELADALNAVGVRRREDVLRLAVWRLETGGPAEPAILLRAAQDAVTVLDPALAERLARAAEAAGAGFPARQALAASLARQGRFDEADLLLARLEAEARTDQERTSTTVARARNLFGLRRGAEAADVVTRAEGVVTAPQQRRQLAAARGAVLFRLGQVVDAADAYTEIVADPDADEELRVQAAGQFAFAAAIGGRPYQGMAATEEWRKRAAGIPDGVYAGWAFRTGRTLSLAIAGHLAEAESEAHAYYEPAVAIHDTNEAALAATSLGLIMLLQGRPTSALRWLRESAALLAEYDPFGSRPWPLAFAVQAAAQAGDTAEASWALAEAEAVARSGAPLQESNVCLGRAWLACVEGALTDAHEFARDAADTAERLGQLACAAMALHDLARMGDPEHAAPLLSKVVPRVEGPLLRSFGQHADGLLSRDAAALEECAAQFAELGTNLYAAEATAAAAVAYAEAGRESSARRATARAVALRARCENAVTPLLCTSSSLDDLTRREREVAALAASGLSSAEIATRLVLSVRTVDNHLQHVYGKLGLRRREDLTELFSQKRVIGYS